MSELLDFEHLRHVFVEECNKGLDSIAESLIALEADPTHPDARHAVFRVAHTVKGGASIVGFARVAEYAHLFEDALEPLRAGTAPVTALQITLLLRATDALRMMLAADAGEREIKIRENDQRPRFVELRSLFRPHLRTVRDIAAMQGKQVRLELEGEDVEVDASIVQQLRDPLLHMIRNAVDHGVESRAERAAAGKPEWATILLRAAHERGSVVIMVEDDGRGLRRDRLLATARRRGMLSADAEPSDVELHALILEPGFSTADRITHLSGRGVGMDVVRQNVESLRGSLSLRSTEGVGTAITLRLPVTIAIIGACSSARSRRS